MAEPSTEPWIFDFDNHYYEAEDAFSRYGDRSLRHRGVRWADIDGKRRLLVGGTISSYVANPTFDPVARPGSLYEWYRGNPHQQSLTEAFGELEPIRPEYRDRRARLEVMDAQGLAGALLFPTLGVGIEEALKHDPDACARSFRAFNRWLDDDWGFRHAGRLFAVPYVPLLDPHAAATELRLLLDAGAVAVNVRSSPVPIAGGYRSPFDPVYDPFWGLAAEHVWITPFWEDDVAGLADDLRVDRLLLGSDWPHAEGMRLPGDFVRESLAGLPDETVRRIGRDNALEVLATTVG